VAAPDLLSGVIGGLGGVLGGNPLAVSRRIRACRLPRCIRIIGLQPSGFCAPRNPGCLETAYPTIQHCIGVTASGIVGPQLIVAASTEPEALNVTGSGIVETELIVAVSTIVEPERAGPAFSRHGDLPCVSFSDLRLGEPLARSGRRPYWKASLQLARCQGRGRSVSDHRVSHPPNSGPHL
jgi:hypothetical protein